MPSITERRVIDLRKLAAIDIAFLGPRVTLAEYVFGVVLPFALGVFILMRQHSRLQIVLGIYFLCLGMNYTPMLRWAMKIRSKQNACFELGDELMDKGRAMAKYRRASLVLLVPLMPLFIIVAHTRRRPSKS